MPNLLEQWGSFSEHGEVAMRRLGCVQTRSLLPAVMLVVTGCAPAVNNRVEAPAITPARVVVMPPVAMVYALDAGEGRETQRKSSHEIMSGLARSLDVIAQENGARVADQSGLTACGWLCDQFMRWGVIASLEIAAQRADIRNYGRHSVADWMFDGDIVPIRRAFDADYALITVFKQARETSGRKVLNLFVNGYTSGKQIDAVCIADLRDGHMSWCATKKDDANDLGEDNRASATLSELMHTVFRVPPRGLAVPKPRRSDDEWSK